MGGGQRVIVAPEILRVGVFCMFSVAWSLNQHVASKQPLSFKHREPGIAWQQQVMQRFAVISLFETIDQWTALQRDLACLVTNKRIAIYPANRHRQGKHQGVTFLPEMMDMQIATGEYPA